MHQYVSGTLSLANCFRQLAAALWYLPHSQSSTPFDPTLCLPTRGYLAAGLPLILRSRWLPAANNFVFGYSNQRISPSSGSIGKGFGSARLQLNGGRQLNRRSSHAASGVSHLAN